MRFETFLFVAVYDSEGPASTRDTLSPCLQTGSNYIASARIPQRVPCLQLRCAAVDILLSRVFLLRDFFLPSRCLVVGLYVTVSYILEATVIMFYDCALLALMWDGLTFQKKIQDII
jgi:hypothetical protein